MDMTPGPGGLNIRSPHSRRKTLEIRTNCLRGLTHERVPSDLAERCRRQHFHDVTSHGPVFLCSLVEADTDK